MKNKAGTNPTFSYIKNMLTELRILSENEGAPVLAYLIEMAAIEATDLASGINAPTKPNGDSGNGIASVSS